MSPSATTATAATAEPTVEYINIDTQLENEWTPEHFMKVLTLRLGYPRVWDRISIEVQMDTVVLFLGRAEDPAWLEYREWRVA